MDDAWFRRWGGIGVFPIRWQGWAMTGATALVVALSGYGSFATDNSTVELICDAAFLAAGVGFVVVSFWKVERRYGG